MTVAANPRIVTDSLIMYYDAANPKCYVPNENIIIQSEDFSAAVWEKPTTTVTANAALSPTGTLTADKVIGNNGVTTRQSVTYSILQATLSSNTTYTFSVYLKEGERRYASIWFDAPFTSPTAYRGAEKIIDLRTGTLAYNGTSETEGITITNAGDGWWRYAVTATTTTISSNWYFTIALNSANNSQSGYIFNGDGVSGLFVWGAQLEASNSVNTYRATTGTASARSTTVSDLSGLANNATLVGSPRYVSTNKGAIVLSSSSYYNGSTAATMKIDQGNFSIFSVQNLGAIAGENFGNFFYQSGDGSGADNGKSIAFERNTNDNLRIGFYSGTRETNFGTTNAMQNNGQLVFVGVTFNRALQQSKFFRNGQFGTTTGSVAGVPNFTTLSSTQIGRRYSTIPPATIDLSGNNYLTLVYNKELTQAEMLQNYFALKSRFGL